MPKTKDRNREVENESNIHDTNNLFECMQKAKNHQKFVATKQCENETIIIY